MSQIVVGEGDSDGGICAPVITYGQKPNTEVWFAFKTPCDVPDGWKISKFRPPTVCSNTVTYAKNPKTANWYAFSTPCDVPDGWESSEKLPDEPLTSRFYSTYSPEEKLLHIPIIYSDFNGIPFTYKQVNMEHIPTFIDPLVFILKLPIN